MESLSVRHEARALRLANNRAEPGASTIGVRSAPSLGTVLALYRDYSEAKALFEAYGDDEAVGKLDEGLEAVDSSIAETAPSIAEAEDGTSRAGIGVINTEVVVATVEPVASLQEAEETDGNLSGAALAEQLGKPGGWGSKGSPSSANLKAASKTEVKAASSSKPADAKDDKSGS